MNTSSLKFPLLVVALAGVVAIAVLQYRTSSRLRDAQRELEAQLAAVAGERDSLRRAADEHAAEQSRLQQPSAELLQLRGEVARLHQQLAGASRAATRVPVAATPPEAEAPSEDSAREETKRFGIRRLQEMKLLLVGALQVAAANEDQFPGTPEAAAAGLRQGDVVTEFAEGLASLNPGEFEITFSGSLRDVGNSAMAIVMRERAAWQTFDGRWARTYGFADGHSEITANDTGDFSEWEAIRQPLQAPDPAPVPEDN